jgi:hypothetical protein
MKKLFLIFTLSVLISACGVQRPFAPTISLLSGNTALPFANQEGMRVQAYSPYEVRLDWDITNTGAQGVEVIIADGSDYDCATPLATKSFFITNTSAVNNTPLSSLGYMFESNVNLFQPGKSFAICISAIMYNSKSTPSFPVYLDIRI